MNFNERIKSAASIITDCLRQYQRPSHLDNEAALREISAIAEEVNALISTSLSPDGFRGRVMDACRHIRKTYTNRQWPMPAHFIKAVEATTPKPEAANIGSEPTDMLQIMAGRMNAGEHVGDSWLYGRNAVRLMQSGMVLENTMSAYRRAKFNAERSVYGDRKAEEMQQAMLQRHADAEALNN